MIQYRTLVRINTAQKIKYTFKDQNGAVINLTDYVSAFLEVKRQGDTFDTVDANITNAIGGQVEVSTLVFDTAGVWEIQFYVMDAGGNTVFGEPIRFRAVLNVEDAALNELLPY